MREIPKDAEKAKMPGTKSIEPDRNELRTWIEVDKKALSHNVRL